MANVTGQFQVYAIQERRSGGPQFIVTTLYRTPNLEPPHDRAEWFVVIAGDAKPVHAGAFERNVQRVELTDDLMLKAALDEATQVAREYAGSHRIDVQPDSDKVLEDYCVRGACINQLEAIHKVTRCLPLKQRLENLLRHPRLSRETLAVE